MSFVSIGFLIFLLVVCTLYFLVPARMQWCVLLAASYFFYLAGGIGITAFLLLSTAVTFLVGRLLGKIDDTTALYLKAVKSDLTRQEKKQYKEQQKKKKKRVLAAALILNIGILIVLKYGSFLLLNGNSILRLLGFEYTIPSINFLLPLGISFYTLQSAGYVIDVFRNKYKPDENFFQYALFVSYFPQIVQGPIARHDELAHQLYEPHSFSYERATQGAQLILWGFMKKLILGERIAPYIAAVFENSANYSGNALLATVCIYGFQAYADFSGGMDIAMGISEIFGISLAENFRRPYFARSIQEFWRRWHITLGAWMRDYVFYTLSLSKSFFQLGKKLEKYLGKYVSRKLPTFLSMFVVFLLVGIWHGAEWKYLLYGIYNGTIIVSSILLEPFYEKAAKKMHLNTENTGWHIFQMLRTLLLCSFGRFLSRGDSCRTALGMMKRTLLTFSFSVTPASILRETGWQTADLWIVGLSAFLFLAVGILQEKNIKIRSLIARQNLALRWMIYIGALLLLAILGVYGPGYSVSEFIYEKF